MEKDFAIKAFRALRGHQKCKKYIFIHLLKCCNYLFSVLALFSSEYIVIVLCVSKIVFRASKIKIVICEIDHFIK